MTIKAIETQYKGHLFRSRLEARWAVFFDALGLKWEYEKEGYDLGSAGWYLPDFWLPRQKIWVEIKPQEFRRQCLEQTKALAVATSNVVAILHEDIGPFRHTTVYSYDAELQEDTPSGGVFYGSQWGWFPFGCGAGYTDKLKSGEADLMDGCCSFGECVGCGMIGFGHFGHHDRCACICDGLYVPRFSECGQKNGFSCCSCGDYSSELRRGTHLANRDFASPRLLKAYIAARSARFEHGQSGAML